MKNFWSESEILLFKQDGQQINKISIEVKFH